MTGKAKKDIKLERILPTWADIKKTSPRLGCNVIGTIIGAIPGTGSDIASGWDTRRRSAFQSSSQFSKGDPRGIRRRNRRTMRCRAARWSPPDAWHSTGDAGSAVMLGALMMQGYHSSPLLFENQPVQVYIIIFWLDRSEYLHVGLLGFWRYPDILQDFRRTKEIRTPIIFVFCCVGTFCMNHNV